METLISKLEKNPIIGTELGNHCFKIRLAITSKGKGKSGGARIITIVHVPAQNVYLLAIYYKGEIRISDKTLKERIDSI